MRHKNVETSKCWIILFRASLELSFCNTAACHSLRSSGAFVVRLWWWYIYVGKFPPDCFAWPEVLAKVVLFLHVPWKLCDLTRSLKFLKKWRKHCQVNSSTDIVPLKYYRWFSICASLRLFVFRHSSLSGFCLLQIWASCRHMWKCEADHLRFHLADNCRQRTADHWCMLWRGNCEHGRAIDNLQILGIFCLTRLLFLTQSLSSRSPPHIFLYASDADCA